MIITSSENNLIKKLKKLKEKKYRSEFGEYFAEGLRWVNDCIESDKSEDVVAVLIREDCVNKFEDKISFFIDKIFPVSVNIFNQISDAENNQGIMVLLKIPEAKKKLSSGNCLFLDRIRDPGNMGTIIRSACATGFNQIICKNCVDAYNPKSIRSSMTGILYTNFVCEQNICDIKLTHKIIAADIKGESVFFKSFKGQNNICLVIGNEANGIDHNILNECDEAVSLPMQNIDSLNAAVSATTLMYFIKNL